MPKGDAAESVRSHAAAFYSKGVVEKGTSPTDAEAEAVFQNMASGWTPPDN
jgi:hypothetical protein